MVTFSVADSDRFSAPAPELEAKGGQYKFQWGTKIWRAREREPITGVWGQSPQRGPGAEPLVRGSGGQSPPEAESLFAFGRFIVQYFAVFIRFSADTTRY